MKKYTIEVLAKMPHGFNRYTNYKCRCEICRKAKSVAYHKYILNPINREKAKSTQRKYYANSENVLKSRKQLKEWYATRGGKECIRNRNLNRNYGITSQQYDSMLLEQYGHCACCNSKPIDQKHRFHVDHDHETGKIRGLLCSNCNCAIGHVRENILTLQNIIGYLLK